MEPIDYSPSPAFSLSFDHLVVDGAEAVRFMNTVLHLLEDPGLILLEK